MKIKMIILALMIVGSASISGDLLKNKNIDYDNLFNVELETVAERVGS